MSPVLPQSKSPGHKRTPAKGTRKNVRGVDPASPEWMGRTQPGRTTSAAAVAREAELSVPGAGGRKRVRVRKRVTRPVLEAELNLTFHPKINEYHPRRRKGSSVGSASASHGDESHSHHEGHQDCYEELPFRPELNPHSRELVAAKDSEFPPAFHYEAMFRTAEERKAFLAAHKEKMEKDLYAECTFVPHINEGRLPDDYDMSKAAFERNVEWRAGLEAKWEAEAAAKQGQEEEDALKECSFRPTVNGLESFHKAQGERSLDAIPDTDKFVQRLRQASQSPLPASLSHGPAAEVLSSQADGHNEPRSLRKALKAPVEPQYGFLTPPKSDAAHSPRRRSSPRSARSAASTAGSTGSKKKKRVVVVKKRKKSVASTTGGAPTTSPSPTTPGGDGGMAAKLDAAKEEVQVARHRATALERQVSDLEAALARAQKLAASAVQKGEDGIDVGVQTEISGASVEEVAASEDQSTNGDGVASEGPGLAMPSTHREDMEAASSDVALCLSKIRAAHGDPVKIAASCRLAIDVSKTIGSMLGGLVAANVERGDTSDVKHLVQLQNNMLSISSDLSTLSSALSRDANNKRAVRKLEATLTRLEDLTQQAMSSGGTFAVKADLLEAMALVPIFSGVHNAGFFNELVRKLVEETFEPGEAIFEFGDRGSSMYFITRGLVTVHGDDGGVIAQMGEGDFFGEIAVIVGGTRTASITAKSYVYAYRLDKDVFYAALADYPQYRSHFANVAQERLHQDARRRERAERGVKMQASEVHRFRPRVNMVFDSIQLAYNTQDEKDLRSQVDELGALFPDLIEVLDEPAAKDVVNRLADDLDRMTASTSSRPFAKYISVARAEIDRVMSISEAGDFLETYAGFSETDNEFRSAFLDSTSVQTCKRGDLVLSASEVDSRSLVFVAQGGISVFLGDSEELVGVLREGNFIGETAFWSGAPQPYTVKVTTAKATLVVFPWSGFESALGERPEYGGLF